jgi:DNA-binding HxlR family transcriptional regulator
MAGDATGPTRTGPRVACCSIACALELVGGRWTLLIVRDVALGLRRFDQLLDSLGVASNILADRLKRLVAEGVLERVPYSERPERFEYRPTKRGGGSAWRCLR